MQKLILFFLLLTNINFFAFSEETHPLELLSTEPFVYEWSYPSSTNETLFLAASLQEGILTASVTSFCLENTVCYQINLEDQTLNPVVDPEQAPSYKFEFRTHEPGIIETKKFSFRQLEVSFKIYPEAEESTFILSVELSEAEKQKYIAFLLNKFLSKVNAANTSIVQMLSGFKLSQ